MDRLLTAASFADHTQVIESCQRIDKPSSNHWMIVDDQDTGRGLARS